MSLTPTERQKRYGEKKKANDPHFLKSEAQSQIFQTYGPVISRRTKKEAKKTGRLHEKS